MFKPIFFVTLILLVVSCSKDYNVLVNDALLHIADGKSDSAVLKKYKRAYDLQDSFLEEESYHNVLLCACRTGAESDFLHFGEKFSQLGICDGYFEVFDTICPELTNKLITRLSQKESSDKNFDEGNFIFQLLEEDQRVRSYEVSFEARKKSDKQTFQYFIQRYRKGLPNLETLGVSCFSEGGIDQTYHTLYRHFKTLVDSDYYNIVRESVKNKLVPSYYLGSYVHNRFQDLAMEPFYLIGGELYYVQSIYERKEIIDKNRKALGIVTLDQQKDLVLYKHKKKGLERMPSFLNVYSLPYSKENPNDVKGFLSFKSLGYL